MRRFKLLASLVMVLTCTASLAQEPIPLAGNWISETASGVFTQLEVADNGGFVYRALHANTLQRAYMCGHLTDQGDSLSLNAGVIKERDALGNIEQSVGESTLTLSIVRRSDRTLVVVINDQTVVLELS